MNDFELKFDPKTIEHLGVKMYSTLPPALAELISNAYDADASKVKITFHEKKGTPVSIVVEDNGHGMDANAIQNKFLVIGRNRRTDDGDKPSLIFNRLPTGKKGLGKLALFGLSKEITVKTIRDNKENAFVLNWDRLLSSEGIYNPEAKITDRPTDKSSGTSIKLSSLKRKTPFDIDGLADSLSRMFIVDDTFNIELHDISKNRVVMVSNSRRYSSIIEQFKWGTENVQEWFPDNDFLTSKNVKFDLLTAKTPLSPSSGLRGISIFSRGKLVNAPEFFSNSTSSHFFEYLTGHIEANFIDLLDEDVISTNRQSINWEHDDMLKFRNFLSKVISKVSADWRKRKKEGKESDFRTKTGIDKDKWFSTLPHDIRKSAESIVSTLTDDEGISENFSPVIEALHKIIPEYPMLHWRHLPDALRERVKKFYENEEYIFAADQGTKIYAETLRNKTFVDKDGSDLAGLFNCQNPPYIKVVDDSSSSGRNIQEGQGHLTRGLMQGFRNPVNHSPMDAIYPKTFDELDCLNVLSLISYLMTRVENAVEIAPEK